MIGVVAIQSMYRASGTTCPLGILTSPWPVTLAKYAPAAMPHVSSEVTNVLFSSGAASFQNAASTAVDAAKTMKVSITRPCSRGADTMRDSSSADACIAARFAAIASAPLRTRVWRNIST